MFKKHLSIKWLLIGIVSYLLMTTLLTGVLMALWVNHQPDTGVPLDMLVEAAESDPTVILVTSLIGAFSAVIASMLVTRPNGSPTYVPAVVLSGLLIVLGIVSIALHPQDALVLQVLKVVLPLPLCLTGARIRMRQQAAAVKAG